LEAIFAIYFLFASPLCRCPECRLMPRHFREYQPLYERASRMSTSRPTASSGKSTCGVFKLLRLLHTRFLYLSPVFAVPRYSRRQHKTSLLLSLLLYYCKISFHHVDLSIFTPRYFSFMYFVECKRRCRSGFTTLPPVPLLEKYHCDSFVGGTQIAQGVGYQGIRWTRRFMWFGPPERNTLRPRVKGVVLLCLSARLRSSLFSLSVRACGVRPL
jgi:hypothetical protein